MNIRGKEPARGRQSISLFLALVPLAFGTSAVARGQSGKAGSAKPAATASAGAPAGWKVIKDNKNKCQLAVPGDWQPVPGFGLASQVAKKARAGVQPYDEGSWSELKKNAKDVLKPAKVIDDGATRFFFTYGTTGLHYYLARSISGTYCVAQVDFDEAGAADKYGAVAKQIIETLDKAH